MTMEEIVITGVATVCVFVAALVFALRMSSWRRARPAGSRGRGRRLAAMAASPRDRRPGGWEERSWSFGPDEGEECKGAPGYGHPPGYDPPPLWTEAPYDPPGWR